MPGSHAGPEHPLEKDGEVVKGKISQPLFFGNEAKAAPGGELRCIGAGGWGIWDCSEGLELCSKTFHDALKEKKQENGFGQLLFCLNLRLGLAGVKHRGFFGVAGALQSRAGSGIVLSAFPARCRAPE